MHHRPFTGLGLCGPGVAGRGYCLVTVLPTQPGTGSIITAARTGKAGPNLWHVNGPVGNLPQYPGVDGYDAAELLRHHDNKIGSSFQIH